MKNGMKILDSDIHVMEPADLYLKYMDPRWGDRIPRGEGKRPATGIHTFVTADGKRVRSKPPEQAREPDQFTGNPNKSIDARFAEAFENDYGPEEMLKGMDIEGVDVAVLFRTQPLFADESQEPEYAMAIARAWNDWCRNYASTDPRRLKVAAQIPLHDVDLAVKEARRAVTELGAVGLCIHPEMIHGRIPHDAYFDPLWAEAQDLNVPLCCHPTATANQPMVGNRYIGRDPIYLIGAITQPIEDLLALVSFCGAGVLEKFPRLRVAFLEGNCSWLPWVLYRLDDRWEQTMHPDYVGLKSDTKMSMLPSEYFRRQCFISIDADEYLGEDVVKRVGDDNLVFSTDWPHGDARYPIAVDTLLGLEGLSDSTKRKILWDNTARMYSMNGEA